MPILITAFHVKLWKTGLGIPSGASIRSIETMTARFSHWKITLL